MGDSTMVCQSAGVDMTLGDSAPVRQTRVNPSIPVALNPLRIRDAVNPDRGA